MARIVLDLSFLRCRTAADLAVDLRGAEVLIAFELVDELMTMSGDNACHAPGHVGAVSRRRERRDLGDVSRDAQPSQFCHRDPPDSTFAFDRHPHPPAPKRRLRQKVRDRIGRLLAGYDFGLDRDVRRELDMIYAAAVRDLA